MSSPPEDMSLEGLIADNWDDGVVHVALPLLEPYREEVEDIAYDFDPDTQSWRDYRRAVWSPVPEHVFNEIDNRIAERASLSKTDILIEDILQIMHNDIE